MSSRHVVARTIAAVALLAATPLVAEGSAGASPVGCGTTITADTTLTGDVGPCPKTGITVGADNITLDLGGFRVFGKSNRTGEGPGIVLNGRSGVTVQNGTVSLFDAGVAIIGGGTNTIRKITANANVGSTKTDFGDGIAISSSSNNLITDSNVTNNGPYDGIGLFGASTANTIQNNVVSTNNVPSSGDDGIRIEGPGAANNTVRDNTVTGNTLDGIAIFATGGNTGNTIDGNDVSANGFGNLGARPGDGIRLFRTANGNSVINNTVNSNAGNGIIAEYRVLSDGSTSGAQNNVFTDNSAHDNNRAGRDGIFDLNDQNQNPACDDNTWSGNSFGTASQACVA